jgi:hypothetical protein
MTCWRLNGLFPHRENVGDDAHDVAFLHDQQLLAVDLNFNAGPLANGTRSPTLTSDRVGSAGANSLSNLSGNQLVPAYRRLAVRPRVAGGNLERLRRDQARWSRSADDGFCLKRSLGFEALLPLEICSRIARASFANRNFRRRAMFLGTAIASFPASSIARALSILARRSFSALANGSTA